jgi:hypothetical protein
MSEKSDERRRSSRVKPGGGAETRLGATRMRDKARLPARDQDEDTQRKWRRAAREGGPKIGSAEP